MAADAGQRLQVHADESDGRYHRQELISWWEQDRLAAARVLVVGAGALGNELLKNLALTGVGNILVADIDHIENSNLSRCVLFREQDEGEPKAQVAARAARELNPDIQVAGLEADVRTDIGLGVFAAADLVLGGLDNREARLAINRSCWKVGTPWIDGAIEGLMGTARLFLPPESACYECTMSARDHELIAHRKSCTLLTHDQLLEGKVPTTATSASVIAGIQVQEAIKLLHRDRVQPTLAGRGVAYNGLIHDTFLVSYTRREDCLSHDTYVPEDSQPVDDRSTTFSELLARASDLGEAPVLDLEHEIVLALQCVACETQETVFAPVERLTASDAVCSGCGHERRPLTTHSITDADTELLGMRPSELGLPRFDCVTARSGAERRHFHLDAADNAFDELVRAHV